MSRGGGVEELGGGGRREKGERRRELGEGRTEERGRGHEGRGSGMGWRRGREVGGGTTAKGGVLRAKSSQEGGGTRWADEEIEEGHGESQRLVGEKGEER